MVVSACAGCGPSAEMSAASAGATTGSEVTSACPAERDDLLVDPAVHVGDLTIDEETDASTVSSLSRVTGILEVLALPDGESDLSFLGCLREVGDLLVISQDDITNLEGLDRLERFARLNVHGSANLRSLDGLTSLRHAGQIWLVSNERLTALGLDQVETADSIDIGFCVQHEPVGLNPALRNVTGLSSITELGALRIEGNDNLMSLDGLRVLAENGANVGSVRIRHNLALPTEAAAAVADLLGADAVICGNHGATQEWDEDNTSDPCYCGPAGG
jgi:hypothetical protein